MNTRQKKKHHKGKWDQIGIEIQGTCDYGFSPDKHIESEWEKWDLFIDKIEEKNICMGGGIGKKFSVFFSSSSRYNNLTEKDKDFLVNLLIEIFDMKDIRVEYLWAWEDRPLYKHEMELLK